MGALLTIFPLLALAFAGFVVYFIFKQLEFVIQAINLYKDLKIRLDRIIALLEAKNGSPR